MTQAVTRLLLSIGYAVTKADAWLLDFSVQKAQEAVKSDCGIPEIPESLRAVVVSIAAGEFLRTKKAGGQGLDEFDLSAPVSQIKEGDTSVSFATGSGGKSAEQRLDDLIGQLTGGHETILAVHRRVRW